MPDPVDALVLDPVERIGPHVRPCAKAIDARRTCCPRLPVREEAHARRYLRHPHSEETDVLIAVSPPGRAALARWGHGRAPDGRRAGDDRGRRP